MTSLLRHLGVAMEISMALFLFSNILAKEKSYSLMAMAFIFYWDEGIEMIGKERSA